MTTKRPLVVSVGEPAGIGLDVLLAAWQQRTDHPDFPNLFLLADPEHLNDRIRSMGLSIDLTEFMQHEPFPKDGTSLPVMRLENHLRGTPAKPHVDDAAGIVEAITRAVDLVRRDIAGGLVTLPINKKSLYDAGFSHPGHTEFLGALAEDWPGTLSPVRPVMMLAGPDLKAVPVTIHIPLKDVADTLTTDMILETVSTLHTDLKDRFGIASPRIAISGLNPHAGEMGAMGREDIDTITPAVEALGDLGIVCKGPLPADTMFHPAARETYDAAVCMYHDQALIPAKALAFDDTVNVTLGLPFIRTSPDHGTAFDIAGTGRANPASLIAAMRMASSMADRAIG